VLSQGLDSEEDVAEGFFRRRVERLVQELLDPQVSDYLGRERYQRREPRQEHRGYRNGYEAARIRTVEGRITVQAPQVRDGPGTYHSKLVGSLRGNSEAVVRLAIEMYARGLSTRDSDRLLSRTAVSELTEVLWEEYEAFSQRDLSEFEEEYLFLDAVYESLPREAGGKEGVLCAWATCADGAKVMLHMALGNKEPCAIWHVAGCRLQS